MKIYEVINTHTGNSTNLLESSSKDALITHYIKVSHGDKFITHKQYRNSVNRRIKELDGFYIAYNYKVKIG